MIKYPKVTISLTTCLLLAVGIGLASAATREELNKRCDEAREKLLAPERQKLVDQCVEEKKDPRHCHNYYKTYGDASRSGGRYIPRKFENIPECADADKAQEQTRASSQSVTQRPTNPGHTGRDANPPQSGQRDTKPGTSRDGKTNIVGRDSDRAVNKR